MRTQRGERIRRCSPMASACSCCSTPDVSGCSSKMPPSCSTITWRRCLCAPRLLTERAQMLLDLEECQLVLVDYQSRLMPNIHESEAVLRNAMRLARVAQALQVPTWGTEENAAGLGENPQELRALCRKTLAKMHFSACADGLVELLRP